MENKSKKILNIIKQDKKDYLTELYEQKVLPKDLFKVIDKTNNEIESFLQKIIKEENVDYDNISNFINKLLLKKVYFNKIISSTQYLKTKIATIKSQTKINTMKENFSDWKIQDKSLLWDIIIDKMDDINSYYAIIQDTLANIKDIKDVIDTTIISLQSQLKNVTFEYLNSSKINK